MLESNPYIYTLSIISLMEQYCTIMMRSYVSLETLDCSFFSIRSTTFSTIPSSLNRPCLYKRRTIIIIPIQPTIKILGGKVVIRKSCFRNKERRILHPIRASFFVDIAYRKKIKDYAKRTPLSNEMQIPDPRKNSASLPYSCYTVSGCVFFRSSISTSFSFRGFFQKLVTRTVSCPLPARRTTSPGFAICVAKAIAWRLSGIT